jgi:hypothetical protein
VLETGAALRLILHWIRLSLDNSAIRDRGVPARRRSVRGRFNAWDEQDGQFCATLLRKKMPQLARLWVEPGVPEIKCRLCARKRPLEIRFSFRGYTPGVCTFIEGDGASCFPCFVGQIRCLRCVHRHSKPPSKSPTPSEVLSKRQKLASVAPLNPHLVTTTPRADDLLSLNGHLGRSSHLLLQISADLEEADGPNGR